MIPDTARSIRTRLAEITRCEALFSLGALYLVSTGDSSVCGDLTGFWEQSRSSHRKPPMQVEIHEMSAIYRARGSGVPDCRSRPSSYRNRVSRGMSALWRGFPPGPPRLTIQGHRRTAWSGPATGKPRSPWPLKRSTSSDGFVSSTSSGRLDLETVPTVTFYPFRKSEIGTINASATESRSRPTAGMGILPAGPSHRNVRFTDQGHRYLANYVFLAFAGTLTA
jgi:hypothetical protein